MTQVEMIREAAARFPKEIGLRAFSGERFKILLGQSYVSEGKVILYAGIRKTCYQCQGLGYVNPAPFDKIQDCYVCRTSRYSWQAFAKGTVTELLAEVVKLQGE